MKTYQITILTPIGVIVSVAFFVMQIALGQGIPSGVSNLPYVDTSDSSSSRIPFGTDINGVTEWLAQDFHTGSNPGGYLLNSVTIPFDDAIGYPTNFTCQLFDATTTGSPNISLGILSGNSDLRVSGDYSYFASNISLKPDTDYFLVLEADGSGVYGNNQYLWYRASSTAMDASPGWKINGLWYSLYGGSWNISSDVYPPAAFEVSAETVPEPSVTAIFLACLASLWSWRKLYTNSFGLTPRWSQRRLPFEFMDGLGYTTIIELAEPLARRRGSALDR